MTYWLSTIWSVVRGSSGDIVSVGALGRLETHVVVAWLIVLAETELGCWGEQRLRLLGLTKRGLQHFFFA